MGDQTVLVTGGCGYIGSHVCRQLAERGIKTVVVDNLSTGFSDALIHGETLYEMDLADRDGIGEVMARHSVDTVLHFAASLAVGESVSDPIKYYRNNTVNTLGLIQAAVKHQVKAFVFSSTAATYGQPRRVPVSELDPTAPESPYGWSKLMSEQILRDVAATAPPFKFVILRYFNVAGADPQGRMGQRTANATHLIKVACEAALGKRREVTVFGSDYPTRDGTGIRDYIHVEDLADAHIQALAYLRRGGGSELFNCGYGRGYSVKEVLAAVREVTRVDFPVTFGPRRAGDVTEVVAGADRIREVLGWVPRYDALKTIVQHAYRWESHLLERTS